MTAPASGYSELAPFNQSAVGCAAPGDVSASLLRLVLTGFSVVVVVQAALGFAGALSAAPAVIAAAMLAAVALSWGRHRPGTRVPGQLWTAADCAGAGALIAALVDRAWAGLHRTTFLYDVMSYHLHLPAAWRAAGRLNLVPTPFGDPAAAYAPANAELIDHLALAATGNTRLAHAGQLPCAALAALSVYTTVRVAGAARPAAFASALALLLIPEVWQQSATAMSDLAAASFFLAALPFLLRMSRGWDWRRVRAEVWGLGMALGLLLGSKYISLVLATPLVIWTAVVVARRMPAETRARAAVALAGLVLACGGFWYARNALLTGNPLFPATLRLGPWTLARGLYDARLIRTSPYHRAIFDVKALLDIFVETGWGFLAAVAAGLGTALRARAWPWWILAATLLSLCWLVIPYQESRFFFSVWGVAAVALGVTAARVPRPAALALAASTLGSILQFPTDGRLLLLAAAGGAALVGPPLARHLRALDGTEIGSAAPPPSRRRRTRATPTILAACGACAAIVVAWARAHPESAPYAVGDAHDAGWAWIRAHVHGRTIAYTGSNLPLPLWGARLENTVHSVSVAGGPRAAPHDFLDVSPTAATRTSAEPAPEREHPRLVLWRANLESLGVAFLFVAALYPDVQRTIPHDQDGFPIERTWADADPDHFPLQWANEGIRIYAFRPAGAP